MSEKNETDLKVKGEVKKESAYTKEQFLKGNGYKRYRDLLNVLLDENTKYSKTEVNKMVENYLNRKVI